MGKLEYQSMSTQRSKTNDNCVHITYKGFLFDGRSGIQNSRVPKQVNDHKYKTESEQFVNKILKNQGDPVDNSVEVLTLRLDKINEYDTKSSKFLHNLPSGFEPLTNQVAGHISDLKGIGMLRKNGTVLKPLLNEKSAEREVQLYRQLETTVDKSLQAMKPLIPKFYGVQKVKLNQKDVDFLVLEDLTKGFKEPCIMDIKIGRRTWDPKATYEKIMAEEKKYHECKRDLGFCIPGFQVYNVSENKLVKYDKDYGKSLNKDSAREAIKTFLNADSSNFCRKLLVQFLASLWRIQHFARNQRRLRLYSSSVLLVYDARRLKEHIPTEPLTTTRQSYREIKLNRTRSLYRPLSLAVLNNNERIPTGFSGQLTSDGPILRQQSNKYVNLESPRAGNNNNSWQKSIHTLKRTHSFQNNYDKDMQNKKHNYTLMLDDLCSENNCEVWATAKMIDFAHVYPADSVSIDQNYLEGIDMLVKMFEDFLAESDE